MRIILATGLDGTEKLLNDFEGIELIEECNDLEVLSVILEYSDVDIVILDRYLDETENGDKIKALMKDIRKIKKDIRFIVLLGEYEEKFVSAMVNLGVFDLVVGEEIRTELNDLLNNPRIEFDFSKYLKPDKGKKEKALRENILPDDYRKIVGIFNPTKHSMGKTTIAVNLAEAYIKKGLSVSIIDTDLRSLDMYYHYDLLDFKIGRLKEFIENKGETQDNISNYAYSPRPNIYIFTDLLNMDLDYITFRNLIKYMKTNVIIIDICRYMDIETLNNILLEADERLLIVDKMINSIISLKDHLKGMNINIFENMSLVINKDSKVRNLSNKEIERRVIQYIREYHIVDFYFNRVYSIPDNCTLLAESMADRERAYRKDKEFDKAIDTIAFDLYEVKEKEGFLSIFNRLRRR